MLSRSASSAMAVNSPDSSICFHRNARASALTSALSVRRGCAAPSGSCISFRPPRFTTRNGTWSVVVSGIDDPWVMLPLQYRRPASLARGRRGRRRGAGRSTHPCRCRRVRPAAPRCVPARRGTVRPTAGRSAAGPRGRPTPPNDGSEPLPTNPRARACQSGSQMQHLVATHCEVDLGRRNTAQLVSCCHWPVYQNVRLR